MSIYDYQRLVGKIEDDPALRQEFIYFYDLADKKDMAVFGLAYAEHILSVTGYEANHELEEGFDAVREWIAGRTNYHRARNTSLKELKDSVMPKDAVRKCFVKTMQQMICIPHVKAHGLWGSDMAVTLINAMYPHDLNHVGEERRFQISLLKQILENEGKL